MNSIYKIGDNVMLYNGDCIEVMKTMPDDSVDAIVTDPPYELGFMNKSWDSTGIANNVEMWKECLRVLKPGGHILSFGGTRTYHRMACAIEDAGFEVRDQIQWLYGSGFPKNMDISKQIDKQAGAERQVIGVKPGHEEFAGRTTKGHLEFKGATDGFDRPWMHDDVKREAYHMLTAPATDESKQWEGWGTCLKPAHEPICLARKPISEKTIAKNVLKWGTGGLNIDACRIGYSINNPPIPQLAQGKTEIHSDRVMYGGSSYNESSTKCAIGGSLDGRFPANIILDEEAGELLDAQAPKTGAFAPVKSGYSGESNGIYGDFATKGDDGASFHADGLQGASRFFYCAKTSKSERNAGLDSQNHHPTVKPVKLMEYLIKLITPPNGVVLDPFMGSGSTGIAARNLGLRFIGIDMEKEYCEIAEKRISRNI